MCVCKMFESMCCNIVRYIRLLELTDGEPLGYIISRA
jgi:hypothetical protein